MSALTRWTGGLVAERDPAQPLLTYLDGPARVELSGSTTANWVAKNANLLVDGLGQPSQAHLDLPLHWQTVCLLLAAVATGAEVVLGGGEAPAGCPLAVTTAEGGARALAAGVDEVVVVSTHPMGAPLPQVPVGAVDHAREIAGYGDVWGGPDPASVVVRAGGALVPPAPLPGLGPADRMLLTLDPRDPAGAGLLLGTLAAGAAAVLAPDLTPTDLARVVRSEGITAARGLTADGVRPV